MAEQCTIMKTPNPLLYMGVTMRYDMLQSSPLELFCRILPEIVPLLGFFPPSPSFLSPFPASLEGIYKFSNQDLLLGKQPKAVVHILKISIFHIIQILTFLEIQKDLAT